MSVPPRAPTISMQPTPMTNQGVLSDFGVLSDPVQIGDVQPDFGWMAGYEIFQSSFVYSKDSQLYSILSTIFPYFKNHARNKIPSDLSNLINVSYLRADWHYLPFLCSRWWTGAVSLRFMAIKPELVTGKLLITWRPDVAEMVQEDHKDALHRRIKYEWDLGTSNEYSLDITGYNVTALRPTWLFGTRAMSDGQIGSQPPLMSYTAGVVTVEVAQLLQPGSLYPDSIRILVFQSFKNCSFHTSTDARGNGDHMFCVRGSPYINEL